jgi:hypothetical protein
MEKETLEEAAERYDSDRHSFILGAKHMAERMYSEEEVLKIINKFNEIHYHPSEECEITEWFEQFKKK